MEAGSEKPKIELEESGAASETHIELLQPHLPYSMPILRRLQFMKQPGGATADSHVLFATGGGGGGHFAAAFADFHKAPETQMWLYSTLEDTIDPETLQPSVPEAEVELCLEQVLAILRRAKELSRQAAAITGPTVYGDGFIIGSVHEAVRALLMERKGVRTSYWNPHDKWLFRVEDLPGGSAPLTKHMRWDEVRREDVPLIISRTNIPKTEATLMLLPSLGVRLRDGTLIAWSFLGPDGSLSTLHCEEPYRGRGIAKALASKLIRDRNRDYESEDGWCNADVHIDNAKSQGVCKSIGGKKGWRNSWTVIVNGSL